MCRRQETDELLCAWETEDPTASKLFRKLLDRSGLEPADTELLEWGSVMGFQETTRGIKLKADPPALLALLTEELLRGKSFHSACAELVTTLMLDGFLADFSDRLAGLIHPIIVADGWRSKGEPPSTRYIALEIATFLHRMEAIGILAREKSSNRFSYDQFTLTAADVTL